MEYHLKITENQHYQLQRHLYPGDDLEAVAILVCGRSSNQKSETFLVHKVIPIPYNNCEREKDLIRWPTDIISELLPEAVSRQQAIFKIHSHPGGYDKFSEIDDLSDNDLFSSIYGWFDSSKPHGSLILLPNGRIFGRVVTEDLNYIPIEKISVVGYNLRINSLKDVFKDSSDLFLRNKQTFGEGTISLLNSLKIGVIGCSGTGSPVIEQLARLGVGSLVLVDPDKIELKNLNRILNSTMKDADNCKFKVDIIKESIDKIGFGTEVITYVSNLFDDKKAIKEIASCDFIFGCVDSIDGRHLLNTISSFYLIPYLDLGIKLLSDGNGGIDQICGTIHYIQPGGSTLLTRNVYDSEELRAANLLRVNKDEYEKQKKSGYIVDVEVEAPAVISINMLASSLGVNEFLSRIHDVKNDNIKDFDIIRFSLTDYYFLTESSDHKVDLYLNKFIGRGDVFPLLNMPELSNEELV